MRSFKFAIILSVLLWLVIAASADAKPKKRTAQGARRADRTVVFDVGLSITYDDNIINYSDADLDLFDSTGVEGKFSIKSKDDWIIVPRISPRISGRFFGDQLGWIDLGFSYYGYASNDVRRYSRLSLAARQYVTPKLYGEVSYAFIPDYYYRNYQIGTTTAEAGVFAEAKFAKHMIAAEAGYELIKGLSTTIAYKFQHKSFNTEFEFRNLNGHGFELGGALRAAKPIRFWGSYGFERATADGSDMADSVLDVSYDSWNMVFGARHYMSILPKIGPELYGSIEARTTKYQTNRYRQIYYLGREDINYLARAGLSFGLPYQVGGAFEYAFAQKDASLPDIYPDPGRVSQTTAELERKLNYISNSITLRLTRRF